MADYTEVFAGGPFTSQASATITAGQLLEVSGSGTVGPAGAASTKVVGLAGHDAASGAKVTVLSDGLVFESATPTGVTAGDVLSAVAAGAGVDPIGAGAFGTRIGIALTTAAAAGTTRWLFK